MSLEKYVPEKLVAGLALVSLLAVTSCVMHANHEVAAMAKAGANPIAAKCAIWGDGGGVCQTYLFLKGAEQ